MYAKTFQGYHERGNIAFCGNSEKSTINPFKTIAKVNNSYFFLTKLRIHVRILFVIAKNLRKFSQILKNMNNRSSKPSYYLQ